MILAEGGGGGKRVTSLGTKSVKNEGDAWRFYNSIMLKMYFLQILFKVEFKCFTCWNMYIIM